MIILKTKIQQIISDATTTEMIPYIEKAFTAYSSQDAVVPPVGTLTFQQPPGDVHIKYGYLKNDDIYVIKIASGFYNNPKIGLPSSNGCMLAFNQKNGSMEKILMDEGLLTDVRTAVAGAVVAKYFAPGKVSKIGIVGTGIQARLQLQHLKEIIPCKDVLVWGRSEVKLQKYKADMAEWGFNIETTTDSQKIVENCNYIVTTTPAKSPILHADGLKNGTHITAMGADTLGKQELDTGIISKATVIVADSIQQCVEHGEVHKAMQAGLLNESKIMELGKVITSKNFQRKPNDISIVDLTGIATQDIQIVKFVLQKMSL